MAANSAANKMMRLPINSRRMASHLRGREGKGGREGGREREAKNDDYPTADSRDVPMALAILQPQ